MNNMDWEMKDNSLDKDFEFTSSSKAMKFINDVSLLAQDCKQNPDVHLHSERFVGISISIQNKSSISEEEIRLANLINRIG